METWRPGDRVIVPILPGDEKYTYHRDNPGTVTAVDDKGVTVELDKPARVGIRKAWTSHAELRRID